MYKVIYFSITHSLAAITNSVIRTIIRNQELIIQEVSKVITSNQAMT